MSWEINLQMRTAVTSRFAVKFTPVAVSHTLGSDCCRDPDSINWRGKAMPSSASIRNESMRMRLLHEAADAYGKAMRKAIDPFRSD